MRRSGMFIAIGLLALVNAVVLGGAASNRSGEPGAAVALTERELPLSSYYGYGDRENTGLSFRLAWSTGRAGAGRGPGKRQRELQTEWFDKAKLEAVGFDCSQPLDDANAMLRYRKMLPRKTFVVLEYGGRAWEAWQADERADLAAMERKVATGEVSRKQLGDARKEYERELRTRSRLFAVDVGNDPGALRTQYGDRTRFLILPATARVNYYRPPDDAGGLSAATLDGSIDEVLTAAIYVPKEHRGSLEKLLRTDGEMRNSDYGPYAERRRDPAYQVTLNVGRRHEPWVGAVRPLLAERTAGQASRPSP